MTNRMAGINIPIFSLRTKKSLGVGEFLDLIPLIDWAKESGLKLIQILPINATHNSYPYSILSAFALNPIYLNLQELASDLESEIDSERSKWNTPHLKYKEVYEIKMHFLRRIYKDRGEKDLTSKAFETFLKKHRETLKPYVAFCLKKPKDPYTIKLVDQLCLKEEAKFLFFVQFHLHRQLRKEILLPL